MDKVAVIGSNSFSGSHLIDFLLQNTKAEVIGIGRSPEYKSIFLPYAYKKKTERFHFFQMDINKDLDKIMKLFDREKPEVVVNFAAQGEVGHSWKWPGDWFQTNCLGIVKLTNKLKDCNYIKRYIHISTPEVYGSTNGFMKESNTYYNPSTPYAASKAAGDMFLFVLVKNFDFPLIMTRSSNVYGIHQQLYRIIPRTIIYLKMGKKIELHGGGTAVKSFIHIRDVADGIYRAIQSGKVGSIYHFAPDGGISISELVRKICEIMGYDFKSSVGSVKERIGQDTRYELDSSKAKTELGWEPKIKFEKGVKEVIKWIEENWDEILKEPLEYIHKK